MKKRSFYLNLIFWIGLSSLIYEIFSTKVLFLFFLESSQAVTIAITAFLAGLAFSSLTFSNLSESEAKNNLYIIFWMQIAVITYAYFVLRNYVVIPHLVDFLNQHITDQGLANLVKILIMWVYLFIPAFFIGGSFPLINGLYLESVEGGTRNTGLVYFWDTLGAIVGAFLAGFLLLPNFGFRITVVVAAVVNLMLAIIIAPKKVIRLILILFATLLLIIEGSQLRDSRFLDEIQADDLPEVNHDFGDILFQEYSPFGLITIGVNVSGRNGVKALFIDYRTMCVTDFSGSEYGMGELVARKSPQNSRILNVGFGCGFTANAIASQENVSDLEIAEINPIIVKGSSEYFKEENGDVLNNPKTILEIIDGAEYIRNAESNKYDGIVIDVEEVTVIYSSPLYSKEYFEIAKDKLKPGGVFALWGYNGPPNFNKVIYNTLRSVYERVSFIQIDGVNTFYASDSIEGLPVSASGNTPTAIEVKATKDLLSTPNNEINTLDNNILEKYFREKRALYLPTDYGQQSLNPSKPW